MTTKKRLFLRWALFVSLCATASLYAYTLGAFSYLYVTDKTKLSFFILTILLVMTFLCGRLTWQLDALLQSTNLSKNNSEIKRIVNLANHGEFSQNLCFSLGLIGTVCGFIIMLNGDFQNITDADFGSTQQIIENLISGMGTALLTTLAGVVSSVLLSIQYHNLTNAIERIPDE